ncbi:MAG: deoxyhypusine synthase [Archaeoglobaceae archaeon]|nr:deoxyhypusine synthase [Archaeoglobaceae archaeon]MCX8152472.1 deoxyhypusine synthase [Archaeoglobaceae archaeon]MDW8013713.1 deoxyhypusine synthase [Archaeoglobaceae archaeon]
MYVESPEIKENIKISDLIDQLSLTAFNARKLGEVAKICYKMVKDKATVFLTLAGAMVPAGMRNIINTFIERKIVSVLISTGANVVHELAEALGFRHKIISSSDFNLDNSNLNRVYDVLIETSAFEAIENFIEKLLNDLNKNGVKEKISSYELIWEIGKRINGKSFLKSAYEKSIPIVSPTLHDSIIGLQLSVLSNLCIDYTKDIKLLLDLCFKAKKSGIIIIGGGVPKNFALQSMLLAEGFDYAVQITTDSPHFGGLSGATLEEAKSWCKLKKNAETATVYCDATIVLPLIAVYILEKLKTD